MGEITHRDKLEPSDDDIIALGDAVEHRFLDVLHTHERLLGFPLEPPRDLYGAMTLWRTMVMRHKQGDKRNTKAEKKATRQVAQWTLDQNCMLRNQPFQKLKWKDDHD